MSLSHPIVSEFKARPVTTLTKCVCLTVLSLGGACFIAAGTPDSVNNGNRLLSYFAARRERYDNHAVVNRGGEYRNAMKTASGKRWRSQIRVAAPR